MPLQNVHLVILYNISLTVEQHWNINVCACFASVSVAANKRKDGPDNKKNCEKQIQSLFADRNENVHATVISHHVIAPGRSPRSGNVASTKADKRQDEPEQARHRPVT